MDSKKSLRGTKIAETMKLATKICMSIRLIKNDGLQINITVKKESINFEQYYIRR